LTPQLDPGRLASSRSYTLSLNPQIIYAQSAVLPTLVSSRVHTQLEFLAVGSWWIHRAGELQKIPSTREDVFNDESLSMKDKRGLMKFLRYVLQEGEDQSPDIPRDSQITLQAALTTKFKISESLQAPLQALALSTLPPNLTRFDTSLIRIRRHMRSMGYFGPGFGAVIAKYGGNSEISQVACRAGAVGGSVYLLGHELQDLRTIKNSAATNTDGNTDQQSLIESVLPDGTRIRSKIVVGSSDDLPNAEHKAISGDYTSTWQSINIVADPLRHLFPQTAENGPTPAVAIVLVESGDSDAEKAPVYLQIHSEDTGECPSGQCKSSLFEPLPVQ
jgi:RAB protein geranylgeranyltransferase component A